MTDVFEGKDDDPESTSAEDRSKLLSSALRGYFPLRKVFVQRPNTEPQRASLLADFVRRRLTRALDVYLLILALYPIIEMEPIQLRTWARLLSADGIPCSSTGASRALASLEELTLIAKGGSSGRPDITLLLEDGSGDPWTRPGSTPGDVGKGYLVLPHTYWTAGWSAKLSLPAKATLLIAASETTVDRTFSVALDRMQEWYGISERSAERGYNQLVALGLMATHSRLISAPKHPLGRARVYDRALLGDFSTDHRSDLRRASHAGGQRSAAKKATT